MKCTKVFAKLDIREAYTQIELGEESRKMTNFNTDGFYRHERCLWS